MADEIQISATDAAAGESTVPETGSFLDAAATLDATTAAPEGQDGAQPDDAIDPQKLLSKIKGLEGGNKQQRELYQQLKAQYEQAQTSLTAVQKELEEARRERQQNAAVAAQNKAQFEITQKVDQRVSEYTQELDDAGVYDERARTRLIARYREAELNREIAAYEQKQAQAKASEFENANLTRAQRDAAIAARDTIVAREAAKLSKQLKAVGVERTVSKDELLALLKQPVDSDKAVEEMQDQSEVLFDRIVADARKQARKDTIAARDADGTDTFETGGSPTLSPRTIMDRWSEGDPKITYAMAKAAERALSRR